MDQIGAAASNAAEAVAVPFISAGDFIGENVGKPFDENIGKPFEKNIGKPFEQNIAKPLDNIFKSLGRSFGDLVGNKESSEEDDMMIGATPTTVEALSVKPAVVADMPESQPSAKSFDPLLFFMMLAVLAAVAFSLLYAPEEVAAPLPQKAPLLLRVLKLKKM